MSGRHNDPRSPPFTLGIELTPDVAIASLASLAARAEQSGLEATFVSNHYNNRDTFLALDRIASETEDLILGPGVVNPYELHPVTIAGGAATLQEATDGRAVLGIGAGDRSTLAALGLDRERPVARVAETIEVARALWRGERVDHRGTFVADAAQLSFTSDDVPIYIGAQGPQMTRMAATLADGLLANAAHPTDYAAIATEVAAGKRQRSEDRGPFTFAGFASVSVATDESAALDAARPPVAFIVAGAPDTILERHGIDPPSVDAVREAFAAGDRGRAYELVTPAMIDAFCVAGAPASVADRLQEIGTHADAIVAASPLGPDRAGAIELLGEIRDRLQLRGGGDR